MELLTPEEVAARLKIARRTVYQWLREGRLKGVKMGNLWRVPEDALEKVFKRPEEEEGGED